MSPKSSRGTRTRLHPRTSPCPHAFLSLPASTGDGAPSLVFGFELTELGRESIEVRMDEAGRLCALLAPFEIPGFRLTFAWQLLSSPRPPSGAHARGHTPRAQRHAPPSSTLGLVVRVSPLWGQGADRVIIAARSASREVARMLLSTMPSAWFAAIPTVRRLSSLLVLPRLADLVELRPRWVPVSSTFALPTPMPGVPDLAFLLEEMRAEGCATLLSLAFEPADGVASFRPLLSLTSDPTGAPVGALLPPTPDHDPDHGFTLEEPQIRAGAHDKGSGALLTQWLLHKLPHLRDAFRVGIRIAADAPLSSSFLRQFAAEFAGEGKFVADQTWRRTPHLLAPAAEPRRPRMGRDGAHANACHEWEVARACFERLEFAPWAEPMAARRRIALAGLDEHLTLAALARLVSKEELAHLLPLPTAAPWLPTHVPPLPINVDALPASGVHLGTTREGRTRVPVAWPGASRVLQSAIIGSTGVGKSTLVANLILEDAKAGHAIVALDPHGQLIDAILPRIPSERARDVVLFDVEDVERPIGINPLDLHSDEERARFVTSFIGQLKQLFDPHNQAVVGPVAMQGLRAALQGAMSLPSGGTLLECYRFFTDEDFLRQSLPQMSDQTAVAYFRQFRAMSDRERAEYSLHIISKLSEWCADPVMRRIIGQRTSSFSFADAINSKKIVLLRLASGFIGTEKATFLGHTFLPMLFQAALSRASLPEAERPFTSVWLDEAGVFGSDVLASMLAQSRKYTISVSLVGQHFAQFVPSVRDAILANANNFLSFRVGVPDAVLLERIFASPAVDERYLTQLPRGVAVARIMLEGGEPSAPFTLETEPLRGEPDVELAREIREFSRELYGRPRAEVDAEIAEREARPPRDHPPFNPFS